jgi:tetratricopeptide (TPR) repeat protein
MSADLEAAADEVCASCGKAALDDVKLKKCACKIVKYCSIECQKNHRSQHKKECKKRMAEIRDERLFRQPDESHLGECPICCLPMPLDPEKCGYYSCCSQMICDGCCYAHGRSNGGDMCPFCRELLSNQEENEKRKMKRINTNDPAAMREMGLMGYKEGDYDGSFEYMTRAAELGDLTAHYRLGWMYYEGEGVEKDEEKALYHYEKAAIGGHPEARHNLGCYEGMNGSVERAVKHFIIAANLGYEEPMKYLWKHYATGDITKEDLEATLRTHKAAIDAMKSPEREASEAWRSQRREMS